MKKSILVVGLVLVMGALTACSHWTNREKGMLAGGVVGGVAGNALTGGSGVGTAVGAVGSAVVGREMSR